MDKITDQQFNATKNTAFGDVPCWYLTTVCKNIDRERASPFKRRIQITKLFGKNQLMQKPSIKLGLAERNPESTGRTVKMIVFV